MVPEDPASNARTEFRNRFGSDPTMMVTAPGRVNLIGDHVDYAGGLVLPIAIERATVIAMSPIPNATDSIIQALDLDMTVETDITRPKDPEPPASSDAFLNYIRGPIEQLRSAGMDIPQVAMAISSSIPMGGGLSSSAALEIATLLGMRTLLGETATPLEMALEAQRAEHDYAGTPCGIMDMYVSAAAQEGMACLIDCKTNEIELVTMPDEEDAIVLIADTRTRHELSSGAYAERRKSCEEAARTLGIDLLGDATISEVKQAALPGTTEQRALHVVEEIDRVRRFKEALVSGDLETAGTLMFESHASLRDKFEVSCPELDLLVEIALDHRGDGVLGSRMTGGGFGGCTVTLCNRNAVPGLIGAFEEALQSEFGKSPSCFATRAAQGAHVIA